MTGDVIQCHFRCVDDDGIWGRLEGRASPRFVAKIAKLLLLEKDFERDQVSLLFEFALTSASPLFRRCREEKLALRIRKDGRSLISPFRDEICSLPGMPLQFNKSPANCRVCSNDRCGESHFLTANGLGHIAVSQEQSIVGKKDFQSVRDFRDRLFIRQIGLSLQAGIGHGAIHRSRVQKLKTQPFRQHSGDGAFTGSRRAINRNNHSISPDFSTECPYVFLASGMTSITLNSVVPAESLTEFIRTMPQATSFSGPYDAREKMMAN